MGSILYLLAVWCVTRYFFPRMTMELSLDITHVSYNEVSENEF